MTTTAATSQTTSADAIASAFLVGLRAPNTPLMRRAVRAWLSAESGHTVIGGNPWNISYAAALEIARNGGPKPIGYRVHSKTGQKFAVYSSATVGATAAAHLLTGAGHDWRGYDKIVAAARAGNPIKFLNALAASAWDAGRYGTKNGGSNNLLAIYMEDSKGNTGNITNVNPGNLLPGDTTSEGKPQAPGDTGLLGTPLGAWGNAVVFPIGHKLTEADVQSIIDALDKQGQFSGVGGDIAKQTTRAILMTEVGHPWDKEMQDRLQQKLYASADLAGRDLNPLNGAPNILGIGAFVVSHLLALLALTAGGALTLFGLYIIARAGSGSPVPRYIETGGVRNGGT